MVFGKAIVGEKAPSSNDSIVITEENRYFSDFLCYISALVGFAMSAEAWASSEAKRYAPDHAIGLDCKQDDARWVFYPFPIMSAMFSTSPSFSLSLKKISVQKPPIDATLNLHHLSDVLHTMGQSLSTNYFERNLSIIKQKFGDNPYYWPDVWNFARVARNSMSHGGKVFFKNPDADPVFLERFIL